PKTSQNRCRPLRLVADRSASGKEGAVVLSSSRRPFRSSGPEPWLAIISGTLPRARDFRPAARETSRSLREAKLGERLALWEVDPPFARSNGAMCFGNWQRPPELNGTADNRRHKGIEEVIARPKQFSFLFAQLEPPGSR